MESHVLHKYSLSLTSMIEICSYKQEFFEVKQCRSLSLHLCSILDFPFVWCSSFFFDLGSDFMNISSRRSHMIFIFLTHRFSNRMVHLLVNLVHVDTMKDN
jgi:hypothetical protein